MFPNSSQPRSSGRNWPTRAAVLRPWFSAGLAFAAATLGVVAACSDENEGNTPNQGGAGAGGSGPTGQSGSGGTSGGAAGMTGSSPGGASNEGPPDDLPLAGSGGAAGAEPASGGTGGAPPSAEPLFPLPDANCAAPSGELPALTLTEVASGLARP